MPNTEYILSLSYGKDSLACLEAIKQLNYPLDRIVHAEVWATDTIPADLPPMVEFKNHADKIILDRYGIKVEHICATVAVERERERVTYEKVFYRKQFSKKHNNERIYGFPMVKGAWCNSRLKIKAINQANLRKDVLPYTNTENSFSQNWRDIWFPNFDEERELVHKFENAGFSNSTAQGAISNTVQYLGIAADEPQRIARHTKPNIILPLVEIGWDEAYCRKWCEENKLLSPIYTTAARGGCWFCHNQGVEQLRLLRKEYPELWALLLKWDSDSPVSFKPDGHTVHDFDKRFQMEDMGLLIPNDTKFRWKQVDTYSS